MEPFASSHSLAVGSPNGPERGSSQAAGIGRKGLGSRMEGGDHYSTKATSLERVFKKNSTSRPGREITLITCSDGVDSKNT